MVVQKIWVKATRGMGRVRLPVPNGCTVDMGKEKLQGGRAGKIISYLSFSPSFIIEYKG